MKKLLAELTVDVAGLAGFGALEFGIYQLHQPSAFIFGGSLALAWAIFTSHQRAESRR